MQLQDIENLANGQNLDENPFGDERSLYKTANDLETKARRGRRVTFG